MNNSNKYALITGTTSGIGFELAKLFAAEAVQDKDALSDPADVAKDGYEALMAGKDKVISGFKNKVRIGISNLMPDSVVAHQMYEQQKPADKE